MYRGREGDILTRPDKGFTAVLIDALGNNLRFHESGCVHSDDSFTHALKLKFSFK
jgi:hypothetical protein